MKLIIASNNNKKIVEIKSILEGLGFDVMSQLEAGINLEPEENGSTFAENAYIKANAVMERSGCASVADDSGIEVSALGGEPGIYSARYGGAAFPSDRDRTRLLLKNMEGKADRRARFVSSIACVFPNGDTIAAEGYWDGEILTEEKGTGGFGYDPVFYDPNEKMTAAEMPATRKNKISHRAKALAKFKEEMEKYNAHK